LIPSPNTIAKNISILNKIISIKYNKKLSKIVYLNYSHFNFFEPQAIFFFATIRYIAIATSIIASTSQ